MNALNFISALLLTMLLPIGVFASFIDMFFTTAELEEMGVRLEPAEVQPE